MPNPVVVPGPSTRCSPQQCITAVCVEPTVPVSMGPHRSPDDNELRMQLSMSFADCAGRFGSLAGDGDDEEEDAAAGGPGPMRRLPDGRVVLLRRAQGEFDGLISVASEQG